MSQVGRPTPTSVYVSRSRPRAPGVPLKAKGLDDARNPQLTAIAESLQRLQPYAHKLRAYVPAAATRDLRSVATTIALLRGTEHYQQLKTLIAGAFAERPYAIGTVGAYFVNCADPAARDTCALPCVGNLVLDDGVEDACPVRVFALANEGSSTRVLTAVNDLPGVSRAIVYIVLDPARAVGGLTASEIESLTNIGVQEVSIYYYDPATFAQTPVSQGFVPLSSLAPIQSSHASESPSALWLAALLVIALLVVLVVWQMRKKPAQK